MKNPFRSILDSSSRIESNRVILPSMIIRLHEGDKEKKRRKRKRKNTGEERRRKEE